MIEGTNLALEDPYLLEEQPTSTGRVFLARGLEHYCALHWGLSGAEISAAFNREGPKADRNCVHMASRLIGEALARGSIRSWARPIGGGDPLELRPGVWELDAFDRRFANSALDPKSPFDADARPTCWIFVDADGFNVLVEASVAEEIRIRPPRYQPRVLRLGPGAPIDEPESPRTSGARYGDDYDPNRLVRLDEVKRRTGLSRSSIYRRMSQGRFPRQVPMSGNNASWHEHEIARWLAEPT